MKIFIIPNMPVMSGRHYYIAKNLAKQGHEVHYIMWALPYRLKIKELVHHLCTSLIAKQYKYEEFTVHQVSRLPYFWPVLNGYLFQHQLRKLFKKLNADIIFTESYTNETEVPKDIPFIYDLADDYAAPADLYGSPIYKLAFKLLAVRKTMKRQCKNAIAVTAVSEILYKFAQQYNSQVIKLPNGVDKDLIEQIKKDKFTQVKNQYSMVYVTGFGEWSRTIETLKITKELRKEFPKLELTLIGKGIETKNIKKFIKDNQAEKYIHYLGFIADRKKLFSLINQSAIGLNISDKNKWRDASHPIKVIEYSALGKKVVSTDLNEVKSLAFPNIFIFSDANKKENLKNTIKQALQKEYTPDEYAPIREHVLKTYNWEGITKKLVHIINNQKSKVNKKRVIHVTISYPPNLGGMEKVVQTLAQLQSRSDTKVSVITADPHKTTKETVNNITIIRLKSYFIANTRIVPELLFTLLKLTRDDIVHLHFAAAYLPEMVWLAAKIKKFKYIAHPHMELEPSTPFGILLKIYKPLVLKNVLRSAKFIIAFDKEQYKILKTQYNIQPSKIKIIPNGVENKFYYNIPRRLHKKPRLLFVGRLHIQKNLPQLLEALNGISDQFETILVGDGDLKKELKELAKDLKLKNITFAGRADGEKLLNYYKKSDIFVLPSKREGMPLVLLEAMAMGLPIIATNVVGNREIVKHNKNGLLVPYKNSKALRAALLKISDNKELYKKLSQTSRKIANHYSWAEITAQFNQLYETNN